MKHINMFGPSLRDPSVIVNRKVAEVDLQAYVAAGYQKGTQEGAPNSEDVKDPNAKAKAAAVKAEEKEEKAAEKELAKEEKAAEKEAAKEEKPAPKGKK